MRTEADAEFQKMLDPIAGSPATGKSVAGIIKFFVDDFSEQVESKWNNESQPDLRMSKLVQKNGKMYSSQDTEFVG